MMNRRERCSLIALTLSIAIASKVHASWDLIASMDAARAGANTTVILNDGRVVLAQVASYPDSVSTGAIYDPELGTWSTTPEIPFIVAAAILLDDGRILATGDSFYPRAAVLDVVSEQWTDIPPIYGNFSSQTLTKLPDGTVLRVGDIHRQPEIFDPSSGAWGIAAQMTTNPRRGHTATLLNNGRVLVVGGACIDCSGSAEIYDPINDSWSPTGDLNFTRFEHTAVRLQDGRVLVVGGYSPDATRTAEIYDPKTEIWTRTPDLQTYRPGGHVTIMLEDGRVLVAGATGFFSTIAEVFDPVSGSWSSAGNMQIGRGSPGGVRLQDGRVLVAGGYTGEDCSEGPLSSNCNSEC